MATATARPATGPAGKPRLYDRRFLTLLSIVFLGFASFATIGPVLPILVLELGGTAATVGFIVAVYSLPSVLLRPLIGRLIDTWSQRNVWILGTGGLALSGFLYVVPSLMFVGLLRLVHGTAWAAFNTGGNTTLARIAPQPRRAEAAGIFSLMPSLAQMVMPSVGLLLVSVGGTPAAFLAAGAIALVATIIVVIGPFPRGPLSDQPPPPGPLWRSLIERRALLPMWIEFLWMSANVLFFIFPPLFAEAKGFPIEDLALYYPVVGGVLIVSRLLIGPRLDRFPRGLPLVVAVSFGALALVVASFAQTVVLLTVAGAIFATGSSVVSPIATALAIDRADPQRRGAAMATYSLGYQLGFGLGSALWGLLIASLGFPSPYLVGILAMAGILAIVTWARGDLMAAPVREDG